MGPHNIKHRLITVERCLISNAQHQSATSLSVTSKVNYQLASLYSILIEARWRLLRHILSQVPHTSANKAIIRYFKQKATKKKDNLKHLLYLLPDKNLNRLSVINNANISDLVVQGCGKSVYVCVCGVCGVCLYLSNGPWISTFIRTL